MVPPKKTADVTKWLEDMFSSLVRGGLEVDWDIGLDEQTTDEGTFDVKARLLVPIPPGGWPGFRLYVQQYALVCGWRVEHLRQTGRFLTFRASRA